MKRRVSTLGPSLGRRRDQSNHRAVIEREFAFSSGDKGANSMRDVVELFGDAERESLNRVVGRRPSLGRRRDDGRVIVVDRHASVRLICEHPQRALEFAVPRARGAFVLVSSIFVPVASSTSSARKHPPRGTHRDDEIKR